MSTFGTDKQTLDDLNILPNSKTDLSIFEYYNFTQSKTGSDRLQAFFEKPLKELNGINYRLSTIKFLRDQKIKFQVSNQDLDFIEYYIHQNTSYLLDNFYHASTAKIKDLFKPANEYYIIQKGQESLRILLINLKSFIEKIESIELPEFFVELKKKLKTLLFALDEKRFLKSKSGLFAYTQINHFDFLIRSKYKEDVKNLLEYIYHLDAYQSVAEASFKYGLGFPQFIESDEPHLNIKGLFHPFIEKPVANDFQLSEAKNLCFVSGANMAGKSTFLKSMACSVYLAHLGFPVPASFIELSLFNGLFTTINLSDNLSKGYSHYYSEVKRVKDIALNLKKNRKALVIFDELFRGTNVKDAYDGTLMVSEGFTKIKQSLFFISTHIVEVAEALKSSDCIDFKCFESSLDDEVPIYDYKLKPGVSAERLGLSIIKNEKIMDVIDEILVTQ